LQKGFIFQSIARDLNKSTDSGPVAPPEKNHWGGGAKILPVA